MERLQNELTAANLKISSTDTAERESVQAKTLPTPTSPKLPKRDEKQTPPHPQHLNSDSDHRPVSALSEEDIQIQENGEVSLGDESDREDDAFDDKVPSPVAPCPYIDFVPLQLGEKPGVKKKFGKGVPEPSTKGAESRKEEEEGPVSKDVTEDSGKGKVEDTEGIINMCRLKINKPNKNSRCKISSINFFTKKILSHVRMFDYTFLTI